MRLTVRCACLLLVLMVGTSRAQFDDPKKPAADSSASAIVPNSEIRDPAAMFGRDAVREALARLVTIERTYRVATTIETVESLRGDPLDEVALRMAKRLGSQAKGIYILIAKNDHKLEVLVSRENTALNTRSRKAPIRDAFLDEFKNEKYDAGLKRGVETIEKTLASIAQEEGKQPAAVPARLNPIDPTRVAVIDTNSTSLIKRNQAKLTLNGAKRLIAAAEAKAGSLGYKMNFAVVDDGGHLLAFSRMDEARPASAYTAITKATTAATFRQATGPLPPKNAGDSPDALLNLSLQNAAAASGGKVTTLLGGVPVLVDGQVIGAIGIGGGSGEQDAEVAKAAVAQWQDELKAQAAAATK